MKPKSIRIKAADFAIAGLNLDKDWIEVIPLGCLPNRDYAAIREMRQELGKADDVESAASELVQRMAAQMIQAWSFDVPLPAESPAWQQELPTVLVESIGKLLFYFESGNEPIVPHGVDEVEFLMAWRKRYTQERLSKKGSGRSKSRGR